MKLGSQPFQVLLLCALFITLVVPLGHGETKPPNEPKPVDTATEPGGGYQIGGGVQTVVCFNAGNPSDGLRALLEQFQWVTSIEFAASVEISVSDALAACSDVPAPQVGTRGSYHYCATGDRYRIKSFVDPARYPGLNTEAAFDGEQFTMSREAGSAVSHGSGDNAVLLPTLPNPMFELLQFRYPVTDDNADLRLRFRDIQADAVPAAFWDVAWTPIEEDGVQLQRASFPGGTYEGRDYVHHLYAAPGAPRTPVRIERVASDGTTLTSSEFSHYSVIDTPHGPTYWPGTVVLRAFDADGDEVGEISYVISDLAVNHDIPQAATTVDTETALSIWDDDLQVFERTPQQ